MRVKFHLPIRLDIWRASGSSMHWAVGFWMPGLIGSASIPGYTTDGSLIRYSLPEKNSSRPLQSTIRYSLIEARLNYEYRRKGRIYLDPLDPESDFVERLNEDLETPTGTPVISHIVGVGGDIKVRPWLNCSLDLSTGYRRNASHISGNDYPFFEVRFNSAFTPF